MAYLYNRLQKDATRITAEKNRLAKENRKPFYLEQELKDASEARKHLVLSLGDKVIRDKNGVVLYDPAKYPVPEEEGFFDSVHPDLRQAAIDNNFAGIVKAAEGFYIAVGIEIAAVGFIRSENGWIIVDTGAYEPAAALARKLLEYYLGEEIYGNVKGVIYSHTHFDHFGGTRAFLTDEQFRAVVENQTNAPVIIGPSPWDQSLVDDNLYAGVAMNRRLKYQGGLLIKHDPKGAQGMGLSGNLGIHGAATAIPPNVQIAEEQTLTIDGVSIDFIPTPNTETRAHMAVYDKNNRVLFLGDNSMGTLHNTYTMRGARVRDAGAWGEAYYHLALKYGDKAVAIYQGHGLPQFAQADRTGNLKEYLLDNAAAYKFTSDQALHLANQGVKLQDIGRTLKIPEEISKTWYIRDHYGCYSQNARGAVNRYLGYYDGNPVHLDPLKQTDHAKKLIEYLGDVDTILKKAEADFEKGEYQWVAEITNAIVFADPANERARLLCADALEQLGYQTHNGLWRNGYLCGAYELRTPPEERPKFPGYMENSEVMPYVESRLILDYMGINLDGTAAIHEDLQFGIDVDGEKHLVHMYKGTLLHERTEQLPKELPVLHFGKKELYDLAAGHGFNGEPGSEAAAEVLKILQKYICDLSEYSNFELIAPAEI
ncbi:MAG: alkyl sulfatase dimerization domain-containing protein [Suilimivivens sp.]